jgi:hypothetical protein
VTISRAKVVSRSLISFYQMAAPVQVRQTDQVTLNGSNKMSTTAVFFDIEKALDTTWHPVLLYKWSKLEFSANLFKFIS